MTRHDPRVRLLHMLDHAREAVVMAQVEGREGLEEKRWLQLALTKLVEIVGEAAAAVPKEVQEAFPTVPWGEVIGWPAAEEIAAVCRRHGIRRLSLFGSALRGEDARDSDLDFLVEFEPEVKIGYFELADIERELSHVFGRSVDLRTPGELGSHMRERVLREAEAVYAAP